MDQFQSDTEQFEPADALFLLNSEYLQEKLFAGSRLVSKLAAYATVEERSQEAYLTILARFPSPDETRRLADYEATRGCTPRDVVCQEIVWALLTSAEFRFNH